MIMRVMRLTAGGASLRRVCGRMTRRMGLLRGESQSVGGLVLVARDGDERASYEVAHFSARPTG